MLNTKKTVSTFMAVLTFQSMASAQVGVLLQPGTGGQTPAVVQGPGAYGFNTVSQDTTKLALQAMQQAGVTRDQDRQFLSELVSRMQTKIAELIKLGAQLNQISAQSLGAGVSFENSYYPLLQAIRLKNTELSADLQSSTVISPEVLPSYEPIKVGDLQVSAPATTKINLGPVVEKLDGVRRQILDDMNAVKMGRITTAAGQQVVFHGSDSINPDLNNLQLLSPQQIQKLEMQIRALTMIGKTTRDLDQQFVNAIVPMITAFVRNYGTSERFRFRDDNDKNARAQAFSQITDAFYRRSYLRKKYGISLGAIQTDPMKGYPKSIANLEKFGLSPLTQALTSFSTQPAVMDTEIMNAFESARNFVQMFDTKLTPVFQSKQKIVQVKTISGQMRQVSMDGDWLAKDTGFIARANSAVTFLTGNQPTAEVMLAVMRMVLADVKEEMFLLQNDRGSLATYHDLRYRSTPELKSLANLRMCQFDWTLSDAAFQAGCAPLKGKNIGGNLVSQLIKPTRMTGAVAGTISHTTTNLIAQIENVELKNRQMADNLQQQIAMAREGALTDAQRQEKLDQELDLFK